MIIHDVRLPELQPGYVEVDLETNGLDPFRPDAKIHCIGFAQDPDEVYWVRFKEEDIESYKQIFREHPIVCRRGTFEGTWIASIIKIFPKLYFDTKLGAFIINENQKWQGGDGSGLKDEAVRYLNVDPWVDDIDFSNVDLDDPVEREKMKNYNGRDVAYDLRLMKERHLPHLKRFPKKAKLVKYILLPAIEIFTKVIYKGFHIDEKSAIEKLEICNKKMADAQKSIDDIAGYHVNPGSPKQMCKLLYEDLGLRCPVKTKNGAKSSSEAALIRLAGKHSIVDLLLEYRKWKKYASTYLEPWLRKGPILHAQYGFTNTDTGRLNSTMTKNSRKEKKLGATLHQCPRDGFIRNLITARKEGHVVVAADLSQAELRLVAHHANERKMIDIFNRGNDPSHFLDGHDKCPKCDIHFATARNLVSGEIDKETRKKAKAVNFGFVYGMFAKKFVIYAKEKYGIDLTLHEGELYREGFFDLYQDLPRWHQRVESQISNLGYIDSVFGRRRNLPGGMYGSDFDEWQRREFIRQGINSPIQSAGSDLNLFIASLIMGRSEILPWTFKVDPKLAFLVGSAHDSLIFECHREYMKTLREGIQYTVANLPTKKYFNFEFKVPILMDVVAYEDCWEGKVLEI